MTTVATSFRSIGLIATNNNDTLTSSRLNQMLSEFVMTPSEHIPDRLFVDFPSRFKNHLRGFKSRQKDEFVVISQYLCCLIVQIFDDRLNTFSHPVGCLSHLVSLTLGDF
jgi:hypothetical protein